MMSFTCKSPYKLNVNDYMENETLAHWGSHNNVTCLSRLLLETNNSSTQHNTVLCWRATFSFFRLYFTFNYVVFKQPLSVYGEEHFSVFFAGSLEEATACFLVSSLFPPPALYYLLCNAHTPPEGRSSSSDRGKSHKQPLSFLFSIKSDINFFFHTRSQTLDTTVKTL